MIMYGTNKDDIKVRKSLGIINYQSRSKIETIKPCIFPFKYVDSELKDITSNKCEEDIPSISDTTQKKMCY